MVEFVYFDIGNVFHTFEHLFEKVAKDFDKKPEPRIYEIAEERIYKIA